MVMTLGQTSEKEGPFIFSGEPQRRSRDGPDDIRGDGNISKSYVDKQGQDQGSSWLFSHAVMSLLIYWDSSGVLLSRVQSLGYTLEVIKLVYR